MALGDIIGWLGLALTTLGLIFAGMAYVQTQIKELRVELEAKVLRGDEDIKESLMAERDLRREADERETKSREESERRVDLQIASFTQVATAVVRMGGAIEHLSEKFGEHQRSQDRALDELKHSIRNVEQQLIAQARLGHRSQPKEGTQP